MKNGEKDEIESTNCMNSKEVDGGVSSEGHGHSMNVVDAVNAAVDECEGALGLSTRLSDNFLASGNARVGNLLIQQCSEVLYTMQRCAR